MFKRFSGNARRWFHRVTHLSLHGDISHAENDYFEPLCAFQLRKNNKTPLKGFYMLELNLIKPCPNNLSVLIAGGTAMPGSQLQTLVFPLSSKSTTKRVVYFSDYITDIKWSLNTKFDPSNISNFKLGKISEGFAQRMLSKKLINHNSDNGLIGSYGLMDLYKQYDLIFTGAYKKEIEYKSWISSEFVSNNIENNDMKISIIMPVYNPQLGYLAQAIDSVLDQAYSNWELCIADDHSGDSKVRDMIAQYASQDIRIKYKFRSVNGNISAASNTALDMATGDYVALLDHDDKLSKHALNEVALAIKETDAKIVYSDEDKINEKGERYAPHFKSDFNLELILSHNYISHLGVYSKDLLNKVGGFRLGYEGAQDYDLLLRCLLYTKPEDITHISKILYHWRAIEGSTAQSPSQKSYTSEAGLKALNDYLPNVSHDWQVVHGLLENTYKVIRPIQGLPKISIIIPTKDQADLLKTCIDSVVEKTLYENYEIIVVNNGSVEAKTEHYLSVLKETRGTRVLDYPKPFNYSAINNFAVSQCINSDYVLLLNNDIEVINTDWLTEMLSIAQQEDVGCVGAKLYYSNDLIQHAGVILGIGGVAAHSHKYFSKREHGYFSRLRLRQDLSAVTAACLLVEKSIYEKVGGFNDTELTVAFNDVDFCLKVRELGLRNVWTPFAELYHYESISRGTEDTPEKIKRFNKEVSYMKEQWGEKLNTDPFYNKNLTLQYEDFSLKANK